MPERYECKLSPEALKKAVEELNEPEDNDLRLAAIDRLRTRFQEENSDLELLRSDDAFLLRFLRVKKFDEDRALKTLENYHRHRKDWPELFEMIDNPSSIKEFLESSSVVPLPGRAKDGTFVTVSRGGFNYRENHGPIYYIAANLLTFEKLSENEEMQIYSLTTIEDMNHFGMTMAMQLTFLVKPFVSIVQDAMPIRLKNVNIINEGATFDLLYRLAEVFMKDKLKSRLTVHGTETKGLQKKIDKQYLPFFLGWPRFEARKLDARTFKQYWRWGRYCFMI